LFLILAADCLQLNGKMFQQLENFYVNLHLIHN